MFLFFFVCMPLIILLIFDYFPLLPDVFVEHGFYGLSICFMVLFGATLSSIF